MGQLIAGGWTTEQSDALTELVLAGRTYAEAAAAINARFGTSYSRNSVIGRAHRIGLQSPYRPPVAKKPRIRIRSPRPVGKSLRIVPANGNSNAMRVVSTVVVEQMKLRCVEIVPRNLTLAELNEETSCRYIAGSDHLYCGHPRMEKSSYCTPHHYLVWEPVKPLKKPTWQRSVA